MNYENLKAQHNSELQSIDAQLYRLQSRRQELLAIIATFNAVDRARDEEAARTQQVSSQQ